MNFHKACYKLSSIICCNNSRFLKKLPLWTASKGWGDFKIAKYNVVMAKPQIMLNSWSLLTCLFFSFINSRSRAANQDWDHSTLGVRINPYHLCHSTD